MHAVDVAIRYSYCCKRLVVVVYQPLTHPPPCFFIISNIRNIKHYYSLSVTVSDQEFHINLSVCPNFTTSHHGQCIYKSIPV